MIATHTTPERSPEYVSEQDQFMNYRHRMIGVTKKYLKIMPFPLVVIVLIVNQPVGVIALQIDSPAEELILPTLHGDSYTISNPDCEHLIVYIWSPLGDQMKEDIRLLQRLLTETERDQVNVITILAYAEDKANAQRFLQEYSYGLKTLINDGSLSERWHIGSHVPVTIALAKDRTVTAIHEGNLDAVSLHELVGIDVPTDFTNSKTMSSIDSDNDGVPDGLDMCPGTPQWCEVDQHGCPLFHGFFKINLPGPTPGLMSLDQDGPTVIGMYTLWNPKEPYYGLVKGEISQGRLNFSWHVVPDVGHGLGYFDYLNSGDLSGRWGNGLDRDTTGPWDSKRIEY